MRTFVKTRLVCLDSTLDVGAEPLKTFVETVSARRARSLWHAISVVARGSAPDTHLDEPCPLPETVEAELVSNLCCVHSIRQILLVGEDEKEGVTELIFVEHPLQLLACLGDTLPIVGIDHEDDALGVLEV